MIIMNSQNIEIKDGAEEIEKVDDCILLRHKIRLDGENQKCEIPRRIDRSWVAFRKIRIYFKENRHPMNLKRILWKPCPCKNSFHRLLTYSARHGKANVDRQSKTYH